MLRVIKRNLLYSVDTFLVHQCNSVTNRAAHLAAAVFEAFPHSDIYYNRQKADPLGTAIVVPSLSGFCIDDSLRPVAALIAQRYPGPSKRIDDTPRHRLRWFKEALKSLGEQCDHIVDGVSSVPSYAFPWRIGCGAAGGNWDEYMELLLEFSSERSVTIYKL